MLQLLAHLWGDYIFQNNWMAVNKTKLWLAVLVHAITYTLPFLFLTLDPVKLSIICLTHLVIDRYRAAFYLVSLKNWCWNGKSFPEGTPDYLSTWITILVDNTLHLTINYCTLHA